MTKMTEHRISSGDAEICCFEREGDGPAVVFSHATGFHARVWDQVAKRVPGHRIISIDMRGHGRSSKTPPPYPWQVFAGDIVAVADHFGLERAVGVGHSMGGAAITLAAEQRPAAFGALLLVDPAIMDASLYEHQPPIESPGEHFVARRRNEWPSAEAMFESFKGRGPYASWTDEALRDYCEWGLEPAPGGEGYVLACPPIVEAAVYQGAGDDGPNPVDAKISVPVRILRARQRPEGTVEMDMTYSPTDPKLVEHFENGEDVLLPEHTHFIPMQDPAIVALHVREMIEKLA